MSDHDNFASTSDITRWLIAMRDGDTDARQRVIESAQKRMLKLARKMLADFPVVGRWEETDDVFQNAVIRLCRTFEHVIPENTTALMRLAARDIRCALIDLARHYRGPQGADRHEQQLRGQSSMSAAFEASDGTHEPSQLAAWSEFHQRVQELPDELQSVVDLLWYQGLSQPEAAECLQISDRTVQRRWRQACLALHDAMHGLPPGIA